MQRTIEDFISPVQDFLEKHGKLFQHSDIEASGRHIDVWELPGFKKEEFLRRYSTCSTDWEGRWDFPVRPTETRNIRLFRDFGMHEGPYRYHMAGYDFDGFYEKGEQGIHDCSSYISCQKAIWYLHTNPWARRGEGTRDFFDADWNSKKTTIIVAFMPERKKDGKQD